MGLSASQARLLLLTAKNDGLELQAQLISNERLLLSQEQEIIADEYSDATSNMIYEATTESVEARKDDGKMGTTQKGLSLETLAQAKVATDVTSVSKNTSTTYKAKEDVEIDGTTYKKDQDIPAEVYEKNKNNSSITNKITTTTETTETAEPTVGQAVAIKCGKYTIIAKSTFDPMKKKDSEAYSTAYEIIDNDSGKSLTDSKLCSYKELNAECAALVDSMNDTSPYGFVQRGLRNGSVGIYIEESDKTKDMQSGSDPIIKMGGNDTQFVRKSAESLTEARSRYYTEDDAQAQAKYNGAMNRVNAMDKKLENKLNQIETQKKAVETEMESAEQLIKTNTERTFKYFG